MTKTADPHCPPAFRFLIQLVDEHTTTAARIRLARIYGERKAAACVLVPGTRQPERASDTRPWTARATGFRCYLPINYRETT